MKKIFTLFSFLFYGLFVLAQGPQYALINNPVCWDSAGITIQLYAVNYHSTNDITVGNHTGLFNLFGEKKNGIINSNLTAGPCCGDGSGGESEDQFLFARLGACQDTVFLSETLDSFIILPDDREVITFNNVLEPFRPGEEFYPLAIDTMGNAFRSSTAGLGDSLHTSYLLNILSPSTGCVVQSGFLQYSQPHGYDLGKIYYAQDTAGYATVPDSDFRDEVFIVYPQDKLLLQDIRPEAVDTSAGNTNTPIDTFPYVLSGNELNRSGFRIGEDDQYTTQFGSEYTFYQDADSTSIVAKNGADESGFSLNRYEAEFQSGMKYNNWKNLTFNSSYTASPGDYMLRGVGNDSLELPLATGNSGKEYVAFAAVDTTHLFSTSNLSGANSYDVLPGEAVAFRAEGSLYRKMWSNGRYLRDEGYQSVAGFRNNNEFSIHLEGPVLGDPTQEYLKLNSTGLFHRYNSTNGQEGFYLENSTSEFLVERYLNVFPDTTRLNLSENGVLEMTSGISLRIQDYNDLTAPPNVRSNILFIDPSVNGVDITPALPSPNNYRAEGFEISVLAENNSTNTITLIPSGSATTINGQATYLMEENEFTTFVRKGNNFYIKSTTRKDITIDDQAISGYYDIGEMRIQWGVANSPGASSTFSLPAAFANGNYSVTANAEEVTGTPRFVTIGTKNTTFFNAVRVDDTGANAAGEFSWQAIGLKPN